jgi:hypothetical protein
MQDVKLEIQTLKGSMIILSRTDNTYIKGYLVKELNTLAGANSLILTTKFIHPENIIIHEKEFNFFKIDLFFVGYLSVICGLQKQICS